MTPIEHGADLAKMGMHVVPVHYPITRGGKVVCSCKAAETCRNIGKHPIPNEWQKGATRDLQTISVWAKHPMTKRGNIGVVTGSLSGIVVLDIDPRHGGIDALDDLQAKNGKLPETAMLMTGGGGMHYYFRHPGKPVKNSAGKVGLGIDVRGENGFVVGPGSTHASGGVYDWEASSTPDEVGFSLPPDWLIDLMIGHHAESTVMTCHEGAVMEGGRNVWLASIAGALRARGCDYMALRDMLLSANQYHCTPQLDPNEVDSIAKSYAKRPPKFNNGR